MLVRDLISTLQSLPADARVVVAATESGYLDVATASTIEIAAEHDKPDGYFGAHADAHVHRDAHDIGQDGHFHDAPRVMHDTVSAVLIGGS